MFMEQTADVVRNPSNCLETRGDGLRILHVITCIGAGGAETVLCRLIETLRAPNFEHHVVALNASGANGCQERRILDAGAAFTDLNVRPAAPNPIALMRLWAIAKTWSPDVVHGWMYHGNVAASVACIGRGVIWGIHQSLDGLKFDKPQTRLVIRIARALSWQPRAIIYVAQSSAQYHREYGYRAEHGRVIVNGVDTALFRPDDTARKNIRAELEISETAVLIGHVARWHPVKDHRTMMRAAAQFVALHDEAVFVFVGEGMCWGNRELLGLIIDAGIEKHVRLCGRRSDLPHVTAAFDIATSSSAWGEALPNVISEAMACGVPCVATNLGDVSAIIGQNGIIVPPRDPDALCSGWRLLAEMDKEHRRALSARVRDHICGLFSIDTFGAAYSALYWEIAESRRGKKRR